MGTDTAPIPGDEFDPRLYMFLGGLFRAVCRVWFRFVLRGMDRIPAEQRLFVGNHSGIGIADVGCLLGAWQGRFGLTCWESGGTTTAAPRQQCSSRPQNHRRPIPEQNGRPVCKRAAL